MTCHNSEKALFQCPYPEPVTWSFDDSTLIDNVQVSTMKTHRPLLLIDKVAWYNKGQYSCTPNVAGIVSKADSLLLVSGKNN